jgi:serine/threonine protein phosphatase 1
MNLPTKIEGPVVVIGDVHGHADLLEKLVEKTRVATPDFDNRWLVFLGDFCDRGKKTRETLEYIIRLVVHRPKTTSVMGNHDWALGRSVGCLPNPPGSNFPDRYVRAFESGPTFQSYGVPIGDTAALGMAMGDYHRALIKGLPWAVVHPQYLFVHAGVLPDEPFPKQLAALAKPDWTLARPPWLCEHSLAMTPVPTDCPLTVVSGHVFVPRVAFRDKRILVDTSGGFPGLISAVLLPEKTVVSVGPG